MVIRAPFNLQQAFIAKRTKRCEFRGEMRLAAEGIEIDSEVAHQPLNNGPAHAVAVGKSQALHRGEASGTNGARIAGEIRSILHKTLRQLPIALAPSSDQGIGFVGGVALEIAAEALFARRDCKFVVRQSEMVEADGLIAETGQRFRGDLRLFEPFAQAGQGSFVDQALMRA